MAEDGKTAPQQPGAIAAAAEATERTVMPTIRPPEGARVANSPPPMPAEWRYDLHDEIARGGMGRVVDATDTVLGRNVAFKEALAVDADSLRRFQRETRITAKLEHPSIVPVHDAGLSPSGAPFYVMRKVSGRPLEDLIRSAEKLPGRLALVPHVVAAAHAIAHAHGRGVVHRDIKPANILVGDNGETIVIDWGLAKVIGETEDSRAPAPAVHLVDDGTIKTRAGIVYGTPGFMAPEQLRGAPVDEQADVYALGATLYYLLARKPPHHAKTGHEMVEAAVAGPATPIRDVVAGVPPELATIVDKALAFDAKERYRDAFTLAEDLNRFLTGQLVASHHYSAFEKLVRWVRRNRALVAVTSAAIVAMIVGGWFAIGRIVDERDLAHAAKRDAIEQKEAAERARESADDRADQLTVADAKQQASLDPTRAIAMIKHVGPTHWPEVRAIAAKARANGVAFGLAASPRTLSLEFARDGHRLVVAGDDGMVRTYDLAKRAKSELKVEGATAACFADDDRRVAIAHGDSLAIVEIATTERREIAVKGPIDKLAASGTVVYWVDPQGAVWTVDVAAKDAAPAPLGLDEPIHAIVPSPDGRRIALAGAEQLLLVDRAQPTLPPEALVTGNARELAWNADGTRLAALVGDYVYDLKPGASPQVAPVNVGRRQTVAYANGRVYTNGATGIDSSRRGGDYSLGLHGAQRGILIAGGTKDISVLSETAGDRVLHAPIVPLVRVDASPRSPYVVAVVDGRLLVWQLDDVVPMHVGGAVAATGAGFVDGDHVVLAYNDAPAEWIDLATGKVTVLAPIASLKAIAPSPDGTRAIAIDLTSRARILGPGDITNPIDGTIDFAQFIDNERFVVATNAGAIVLNDSGRVHQLAPAESRVVALVARGTHVAASFADGTLWRGDVGPGGTSERVSLGTAPTGIAIDDGGTVVIAAGKILRVWRPNAKPTDHAAFPHALVALALVRDGRMLAVGDDGRAFVVRLGDAPDPATAIPVGKLPKIASDGALVATINAMNQIEAIDVDSRTAWTLGGPRDARYGIVEIAPDGRRALALAQNGVLVWSLALPSKRDDLDAMTNADASAGPTLPLGWK